MCFEGVCASDRNVPIDGKLLQAIAEEYAKELGHSQKDTEWYSTGNVVKVCKIQKKIAVIRYRMARNCSRLQS